jgi:hypothetical protein
MWDEADDWTLETALEMALGPCEAAEEETLAMALEAAEVIEAITEEIELETDSAEEREDAAEDAEDWAEAATEEAEDWAESTEEHILAMWLVWFPDARKGAYLRSFGQRRQRRKREEQRMIWTAWSLCISNLNDVFSKLAYTTMLFVQDWLYCEHEKLAQVEFK